MELRRLHYFVIVAEEQNFGRAAKRLGVAQSSISRQVQRLEQELGGTLLVRTARGTQLTKVGQTLLEEARRVVAAVEGAVDRVRALVGEAAMTLRVGCVEGVTPGLVAAVFAEFRRRLPKGEVEYCDLTSLQQWQAVRAGAIHIGFARYHLDGVADLATEAFVSDPLDHALLPVGHRLATEASISVHDLANEPLVWGPQAAHPFAYQAMQAAFAKMGFEPQLSRDRPSSLVAAWSAVAAGVGWTLTPRSLAGAVPQNTRCVSLVDFRIPFGLDMVHATKDRLDLTRSFLDVARTVRDHFVKQGRVGAPTPQLAARASRVSKRRRH